MNTIQSTTGIDLTALVNPTAVLVLLALIAILTLALLTCLWKLSTRRKPELELNGAAGFTHATIWTGERLIVNLVALKQETEETV